MTQWFVPPIVIPAALVTYFVAVGAIQQSGGDIR
jgi:hypothetical protein